MHILEVQGVVWVTEKPLAKYPDYFFPLNRLLSGQILKLLNFQNKKGLSLEGATLFTSVLYGNTFHLIHAEINELLENLKNTNVFGREESDIALLVDGNLKQKASQIQYNLKSVFPNSRIHLSDRFFQ